MGQNYWRKHSAGRDTIETTARWVGKQAEQRGLSLHDYVEGRVSLRDLGVTSEEAAATLKPLIPCAHDYYNCYGPGSKTKFTTWEEWFGAKLRNRIYYFFHKHEDGKIVLAWAEWPIEVPPDNRAVVVAEAA